LSLSVPSNRRDLFGRRILTQSQKTLTTGQRTIRVKELPQRNKPESFTGAVGQFDFDVILDKDALKASESFQAKVKVKGKGNLKLFNLPNINFPNTLEVYEPEHDEQVKINISGMEGTIEDNYTIVPQFQGKYPIPSVEFSYFDPLSSTYKTLNSQDLIVDVFDGPTASVSRNNAQILNRNQLLTASEDAFRFINLDTKLTLINQRGFWMSRLFWILLLLPILLLFSVYMIKRFVMSKSEDTQSLKQRKAKQLAKKYLSSAKNEVLNQARFYEALERALHNYLKAKLKIETTEMNKSKIEILLLNKQVEQQIASDFIELIENCEKARYAPGSSVNIQGDFEKATALIVKIDRQL